MEEVRSCEEVSVFRVGARVVAMLLVEVIVMDEIPETRVKRKEGMRTENGKGRLGFWNVEYDAAQHSTHRQRW